MGRWGLHAQAVLGLNPWQGFLGTGNDRSQGHAEDSLEACGRKTNIIEVKATLMGAGSVWPTWPIRAQALRL